MVNTLYMKAYQTYYEQNYEHCLKLLQEIKCNDSKKLDLLAQVYFRQREYQKSYDLYHDLLETHDDEFNAERKENLAVVVACAQLERPNTLKLRTNSSLPKVQDIVEQVQQINLNDDSTFNICAKPKSSRDLKGLKKHTNRKPKLPKSYNPNVTPDPERWLPMRDRKGAAHRHKQKRRQRPNAKGKGKR